MDLTKAASEAAMLITPVAVRQIMSEEFQAEDVAGIPQDLRQQFLDRLTHEGIEAGDNIPF